MNRKNILLVNPTENLNSGPEPYPSGALILLGTMACNKGHNVKIVHMGIDNVDGNRLKDILLKFKPDIIGITLNTFQTKSVKKITKIIKKTDRNFLVVVGGPHPSGMGIRIFNDFPHIDVAVFAEGENTFLEIVERVELSQIKGLAYRDKTGEIKMNEPRSPAMNLDYIPLPNLDLADFNKNKFRGVEPVSARPAMYIMASRGCPFHCIYCNKSIWGRNTRFRKPELIIREIKWLYGKYNVRDIFFQDDTFNLNRKWAENIFNLIIKNGLNKDIVYRTPFRANRQLVDLELLKLAKKANFRYIFYGVESGNQEMLDRMKKGLTISEIKRAFELTYQAGIKPTASFVFGLPGETRETIKDTINLWKEISPFSAGCSFATPLPGTEFEKTVIKNGHLLDSDYDHYGLGACVVRTKDLTKKDLEYYRTKFKNKIELVGLRRNLRHIITNRNYFKKIIVKVFKDPGKLIKGLFSMLKKD
jgi:radical SAM superfamily enzyme YgiQ (UPF0313 family)